MKQDNGSLKLLLFLALVLSAVGLLSASPSAARRNRRTVKWDVLRGCQVLKSKYADADTLHVQYGGREMLFRLYFVDAPEMNRRFGRAAEQASYWGISEAAVVANARDATALVGSLLKGEVAIRTKWERIGHDDNPPRYYAFVQVDGEDLGKLLLKSGYARVFGKESAGPDGESKDALLARLRHIENQSRHHGTGVWQLASAM